MVKNLLNATSIPGNINNVKRKNVQLRKISGKVYKAKNLYEKYAQRKNYTENYIKRRFSCFAVNFAEW